MSDAEQQADASPRRGPGIACAVMGIAAFLCVCGGATWSVTRLYDWASTEADRIQEVLTEEARDAAPTVLNLSAGDAKPDQVKLAAQVLRERMATLGIEASVTIGTGGRIDIALSTEDVTRAVPVLLAGGDLQFKLVSTLAGPERDAAIAKVQAEREAATYDAEAAPFDVVMQGDSPLLVENPGVPGYLIVKVYPAKDSSGKGALGFEFGKAGKERFRAFTASNVGRTMAVVLDGVVEVAPRIHDAIDGSGIILNDDGYTPEEVENMVTILGSGKLPVTLSLEAE